MPATQAISVIICTWNRCNQLASTLRSLSEQTGIPPGDIEVIVVDNNSSDDTQALVSQLAQSWKLGLLRYEFEGRQGKQFALNKGVRSARHEVLAFTDDDILFSPDWLLRIRNLISDTGIELAGGKTVITWPDSGRPKWYDDDMQAILGGVDLGDRRLDPAPAEYAPGGANLVARRSLFERLGSYSETHFRHMDYEFGKRCSRHGVRMVYEPSIIVYAPVDAQCLTRRYFRRWSFKAGIADDGVSAGELPRGLFVPRWIYRRVLEDALWLAIRSRSQASSARFSRELRLWRNMGTIANAWHARFRPSRHALWVESYSQKKNNFY